MDSSNHPQAVDGIYVPVAPKVTAGHPYTSPAAPVVPQERMRSPSPPPSVLQQKRRLAAKSAHAFVAGGKSRREDMVRTDISSTCSVADMKRISANACTSLGTSG